MKIVLIHAEEKVYGKVSCYIDSIMDVMGLETKEELVVNDVNRNGIPTADVIVIKGIKPDTFSAEEIQTIVNDGYHPNKLLCLVIQERYNALRFLLEFIGNIAECRFEAGDVPHFVKYNQLNSFLKHQLENNADLLEIISKFKFCLDVTNEDRATIVFEENNIYALNNVALNIESEKDITKDAAKESLNYVMHCGMIDNGTYLLMENYVPKVVRLVRGKYDNGTLSIVAEYAHGKDIGKFCSKITMSVDCGTLNPDEAYVNTDALLLNRVKRLDDWLVENGLATKTDKVFKTGCFEYPLMKFNLDKIPLSKRKIIMGRKLLNDGALAVKVLDMATGDATEKVYSEKQYQELAKQFGYVD